MMKVLRVTGFYLVTRNSQSEIMIQYNGNQLIMKIIENSG